MRCNSTIGCVVLCLFLGGLNPQDAAGQDSSGKGPTKQTPPPKSSPPPVSEDDFTRLKENAEIVREAENIPEAIGLYKQLVLLRPNWAEGWWYLGTLFYDADQFDQAGRAFAKLTLLQPKNGTAWAMLGLCEYKLRMWASSSRHIGKARQLGVGGNSDLNRVVRYHQALLLIRGGQFEEAQLLLKSFCIEDRQDKPVMEAFGLATLRIPRDVESLSVEDQEMVLQFGRAAFLEGQRKSDEAFELYQSLEQKYRGQPNVAYAFGAALLLRKEPGKAVPYFQQELARDPGHFPAQLQLGILAMDEGKFEEAAVYARKAVGIDPKHFTGHFALGRIYLYQNQLEKAIVELEKTTILAPDFPAGFYSLSQAYQRANRPKDSERARAEFTRLETLRKKREGGATSQDSRDESSTTVPSGSTQK
jgi:predicted Zn-dependent protease